MPYLGDELAIWVLLPTARNGDPVGDHPFAFVLMHEPSGTPLLEGVVGDPTATQR